MSFETSAELSLTVDEGDLQNVKQQIESEIGTTAVGVTDGGSMSAQSAGSSGGGRGRRARRSMRLAETRNEYLEDVALYLESIDDKVGGGGGGGGAGGIFTELFGAGAESGADLAIEGGSTAIDGITTAVGTAVGQAVGGLVGGNGGGDTRRVVSRDTNVRTTIEPVFNPEFNPKFQPTFHPEFSPQFSPEFTPELDVAPKLSVSPQVDVSPELNVDFPEFDFGSDIQSPHPVEVTNWPTPPSGDGSGADQAPRRFSPEDNIPVIGPYAKNINDRVERFSNRYNPLSDGELSRDNQFRSADTGAQRNATATTNTTVENNVDADVRPNITINIDTRQLLDDVEQAIEDANAEVRRDLLNEIERVANDLDDLERQITRGRT